MVSKKLLSTISNFHRKTWIIQVILYIFLMILSVHNETLSNLLIEFTWRFFPGSDVDSFSFRFLIVIMVVPFFVMRLFFSMIAVAKHFIGGSVNHSRHRYRR